MVVCVCPSRPRACTLKCTESPAALRSINKVAAVCASLLSAKPQSLCCKLLQKSSRVAVALCAREMMMHGADVCVMADGDSSMLSTRAQCYGNNECNCHTDITGGSGAASNDNALVLVLERQLHICITAALRPTENKMGVRDM